MSTVCDPNDPTLLKPDLVASRPTRLRTLQRHGNRRLYFVSTIANVGAGPLMVRGETIDTPEGPVTFAIQDVHRTDGSTCEHDAGEITFDFAFGHWGLASFAEYQLRKDDPHTGEIVARTTDVPACLSDLTRVHGFRTTRTFHTTCHDPDAVQGLSAGFAHVEATYHPHSATDLFFPGLGIDLDSDPSNPVPGGNYFLVVVPNPEGRILEASADPQTSYGSTRARVIRKIERGRHGTGGPRQPLAPGVPRPSNR